MKNSTLISLKGENLDTAFGWIDWRGSEQEVVDIVQRQLGDDWALKLTTDDERAVLTVQGADYTIPLTRTGSDRYVMLCSLAEIFKETHVVWLHKERLDDDTHGVLVLPRDQSDELKSHHAAWVEQHLSPLRKGFARNVADRVLFMIDGCLIEQAHPKTLFPDAKSEQLRGFLASLIVGARGDQALSHTSSA